MDASRRRELEVGVIIGGVTMDILSDVVTSVKRPEGSEGA